MQKESRELKVLDLNHHIILHYYEYTTVQLKDDSNFISFPWASSPDPLTELEQLPHYWVTAETWLTIDRIKNKSRASIFRPSGWFHHNARQYS